MVKNETSISANHNRSFIDYRLNRLQQYLYRKNFLRIMNGTRRRPKEISQSPSPTLNVQIIKTINWIIFLLLFQTISECDAVKILNHWISQTVDSTNHSNAIIMDCDYEFDRRLDQKLVIRWFRDNHPEPIYQWIPESDSRYIGDVIRDYFDSNYQIGDDPFRKHRAIRLMPKPLNSPHNHEVSSSLSTISSLSRDLFRNRNDSRDHLERNHLDRQQLAFEIELSGNYTCVIASIMSQDSRQGSVFFYVPPKKFEFNIYSSEKDLNKPKIDDGNDRDGGDVMHENSNQNGPMVRCSVEDVYPKPILSFSETISLGNGYPPQQTFPLIKMQSVINDRDPNRPQGSRNQSFNVWFEYRLGYDSIKVGTIYECRLEIPYANYIRKKRIKLIYPSTYFDGSKSDPNGWNKFGANLNRWSSRMNQDQSDHSHRSRQGFQARQHRIGLDANQIDEANSNNFSARENNSLAVCVSLLILIHFFRQF